ncbi:uncharacterized protein LOC128550119 [Mercenaria mercenaria]|uniref:uncharacterized protein LOC128550119 n=1 Tax=Mercenaria mercenaria TaxID=6596 RepID=UPI00234E3AFB|nr:uncharacterized protein LOC128550119 [Mercenaria mercenaria]
MRSRFTGSDTLHAILYAKERFNTISHSSINKLSRFFYGFMMPRKKRLTVGMPAKRRSAKVIKIEVIGLEPEEYQNSNDHTYFNESYTVEKYDTDTNEVSGIADFFKNDHTYASLSGYFPPKSWDAMGYSDTAHGQCIFSEEDTHLNEECISFWEKDVLFNHVFCVYENDEVRDNKNVDKKNLDILRDKLSAMFHKRYLFHRSKSVLKLIELYDSENPSIKLSINFFKDLTCEVYVHRQKISNEHEIWHKLPAHLTVLDKAVSLVERISRYNVCVGNPEKEYTDLVPVGEGLSDNKEPGILAVHEGDFKAKTVIGKEYNGTIRTVKCHLLVTGSRCKVCSKYRNALRRRKERLEERQSSNRKYNHTHFKHKDMTHNELLKKLDEQKNEIKSLKEEMIRTKREFDKMKTKVGMKMETNQHNKVKDLKASCQSEFEKLYFIPL